MEPRLSRGAWNLEPGGLEPQTVEPRTVEPPTVEPRTVEPQHLGCLDPKPNLCEAFSSIDLAASSATGLWTYTKQNLPTAAGGLAADNAQAFTGRGTRPPLLRRLG